MKIVFVAELAHDIDDIIACKYLHLNGLLECVVLDGTSNDITREKELSELGVKIVDTVPKNTKMIACGGALTKVSEYLDDPENELDFLVFNGCFAGTNLVPSDQVLPKFKDIISCRSWNPNLDPQATLKVFKATNCKQIVLVSKNVCHHPQNTRGNWHNDAFLFQENSLKDDKRLHDLLMVKEAQHIFEKSKCDLSYCSVRINFDHDSQKWSAYIDPNSKIMISIQSNH